MDGFTDQMFETMKACGTTWVTIVYDRDEAVDAVAAQLAASAAPSQHVEPMAITPAPIVVAANERVFFPLAEEPQPKPAVPIVCEDTLDPPTVRAWQAAWHVARGSVQPNTQSWADPVHRGFTGAALRLSRCPFVSNIEVIAMNATLPPGGEAARPHRFALRPHEMCRVVLMNRAIADPASAVHIAQAEHASRSRAWQLNADRSAQGAGARHAALFNRRL